MGNPLRVDQELTNGNIWKAAADKIFNLEEGKTKQLKAILKLTFTVTF